VAVTAVDAMGNRIGVVLSDVEENVALDPSLFVFVPPAGAKIVDQEPPSR
jgi:outer membrane lipoprotein-sorting protein